MRGTPDPNLTHPARGQTTAIRAERQSAYSEGISFEVQQIPTAPGLPDLHQTALAAGRQPVPVSAVGQGINSTAVPSQHEPFPTARGVPDRDRTGLVKIPIIATARGEIPAIRAVYHAMHLG